MTLTLAGVAAFVLSVGMAVDANILIFERTKEELRSGKTLVSAIEAGFNRAWNSIFDSNMSSIITATILFYFGSATIRGFALVLIIGVLVSMFTAITLSRQMLRWIVRQPWARKASLFRCRRGRVHRCRPATAFARRPGRVFDLIGKRRWFYLFSLADHHPGLHLHPPDSADRRQGRPPVLDRLHRRHRLGGPLRERHPVELGRPGDHGLTGPARARPCEAMIAWTSELDGVPLAKWISQTVPPVKSIENCRPTLPPVNGVRSMKMKPGMVIARLIR